ASPQPRPAAPVAQGARVVAAAPGPPATALVPVAVEPGGSAHRIQENSPALRMKVELEVSVPVRDFRVRKLLALEPGVVVESRWSHSEDLPLAAGRVQLAWTEFEVVDTQLAARLTRLN
ncbi:MAG: FliM/FliN family flagellar motor C-terminal domain-containing protein, partial [Terracidiphilus sp.]